MNNNKFIIKSILIIICFIAVLGTSLFVYSVLASKLKLPYGDDKISTLLEHKILPKGWDKTIPKKEKELPVFDEHRLFLLYAVNEEEKISATYVEIINVYDNTVYYIEIPMATKISLSSDLFTELSNYGPELPQYFKLSRVENYFSRKYRYEALTQIIGELTSEHYAGYMAVSEGHLNSFLRLGLSDRKNETFYSDFEAMVLEGRSNLDSSELYTYYEYYLQNTFTDLGTMPGTWDVTDYLITSVTARETIEKYRY